MVSGGADPTIRLWDLESRGAELDHTHVAVSSVHRYFYDDMPRDPNADFLADLLTNLPIHTR